MSPAMSDPVFSAALALPDKSRAALADLLWASLDEPTAPEIVADHLEEIQRRQTALEEGRTSTIAAEEVFARHGIKEPL